MNAITQAAAAPMVALLNDPNVDPQFKAAVIRDQIKSRRRVAETGEQWAEICRLAVELERFEDAEDDSAEYPAPHSQFGVGA